MYYHDFLSFNTNNTYATWKVIKEILAKSTKSSFNNPPPFIETKTAKVESSQEIAHTFNDYFSTVGITLANTIKNKDKTGYLTYLDNKVSSSLYLNPPTYVEVYGILNSLNIKTSTGPDDIPPYFIKTTASVLTPYLVFFISMSFKLGIFSTCLKTAKVIPGYI